MQVYLRAYVLITNICGVFVKVTFQESDIFFLFI